MSTDSLRDRYVELFGLEAAEAGEVDRMETELGLRFPADFKKVSTFYSGGILGGISHHAIAMSGAATNITDETIRLRKAGLPQSYIVLAEPPASLVVMNPSASRGSPVVLWIDAVDFPRLAAPEGLRNPQTWTSYAEFFSYLLDTEEEEQGG